MYFDFKTEDQEKVKIKFALSPVSQENALENMRAEIPGWDFNKVKAEAKAEWNKELNKITVNTSEDDKVNFYTAMYQLYKPTVYTDVNGQYKG